jgi:hypothetical protein
MRMTASSHGTTLSQDRIAADLDVEIVHRVIAAGLTLQETAAIAVDPFVRRRIERVLDDLDKVVRVVRDAAFTKPPMKACGLPTQPGCMSGERDELVRYWTDQGESALDLGMAALTRVNELRGGSHADLGILRDKLVILRTLMNGR